MLLLSMLVAAQLVAADTVAIRLQALADSVTRVRPRVPGVLLHVQSTRTGQRWVVASGMSDTAAKRPMSTGQPLRIASNTKTYTAAAVLRLVEQGRIRLDDPIARHLPPELDAELRRDSIATDRITIAQLLSHRAGLDEHPAVPSYIPTVLANPTKRWTRIEQVRWMVDSLQPVGPPDGQFRYSDTGYILLGAIIERHTGKNLGASVRDLVQLDRLGLAHTWFETLEPVPAGTPDRVHQYINGVDTYAFDPSLDLYGGGGIAAPIAELGEFLSALMGGRVFEQRATLDTMLAIRSTGFLDGYGMGMFRMNVGGVRGFGHSGFWGTIAVHFPSEELTIAVAVNEQSQGGAIFGLLGATLRAVAPLID